jgi:transmembrane sensor
LKKDDFLKIERYIKGESSESDREYIESLFINGENHSYFRNCLNEDWELILEEDSESLINLSHLLDRIHHIIRKNETSKRQKPLQKIVRLYMKAAAILLLPLLLTGSLICYYMFHKQLVLNDTKTTTMIYAPIGSRVSFNLPDGTVGMLNSDSRLSYSLPFKTTRQVKLVGEAWFEVNHDEEHPFEIMTGNSIIKVSGTKFNMSAYPTEDYVEVVLREGKIEFLDDKGNEKSLVLPSERLVFRNGKISKSVVDPEKYIAWTEGKLVFRSDSMAEVARRIERWYNVKIDLADKELDRYSFRATFNDDPLDEVLRCLALTSPISYKITPRTILSDGTYRKEEIIIYKIK